MRKQTIAVLANDVPGVLQRVSALFGRRGYNIASITVGASEREGVSRLVIVANEDERTLDQMCSQLRKLIDVVEVIHLSRRPTIARELMLIRLQAEPAVRPELFALIDTFRCSVVDVGRNAVIVQVVGDTEKNDAFLRLLEPYGVLELTRTGETAINR